ncbi:MoaD/ThiS family protein [Geomonas azotofigens]|uniref:MoaD/ThiS family protein n=1 Tax=Geomonas azotofigens TaxID=2843196 RepID=UPI001C110085|nr:MoaD/ThiS family protein [Geomonas azotofigens]MBU5613878.1 MoaD/ThiS family protein [Geomonas azotofigens]
MQVTVKLFASLRYRWFEEETRQFPDGSTLLEVVDRIGIPKKELGITLINGSHASLQDVVLDGDVVALMPHIGGG